MVPRLSILAALLSFTFPSLTSSSSGSGKCAAEEGATEPVGSLLQSHQSAAPRGLALLEESDLPWWDIAGWFGGSQRRGELALTALRSEACRSFYAGGLQAPQADSLAWDEVSELLRPSQELPGTYGGPMLGYSSIRRMLTYEDIAVPPSFSREKQEPCTVAGCPYDYEATGWCMPYAVHTAQRPIKVNYLQTGPNQTLMAAAVWKCASTSLTAALASAPGKTGFWGPQTSQGQCEAQGQLPGCNWTTSFVTGMTEAKWKVASFRHPLDRFVSSVYEHNELPSCLGEPCQNVVQEAQGIATRLLKEFPGHWRSCEHATQSYFLSATDMQGTPIAWDFLLEVDQFGPELEALNSLTQMGLTERHNNTSGDNSLKQKYFNAIFANSLTICSVCKVYAQDFTCLGYDFPDRCTNEACAQHGIQFP